MQKYKLIACFLLAALSLNAQTPISWEINHLEFTPELDGGLDDSCWQLLPPLTAFTTSSPLFGNSPRCHTEVQVFYTQTAMYLAAYCYDPDSAGIRREAGIRDGLATGDWLRISLDTWNDDQLAFDFTVTAAGVQQDARQGASNWDALWQSAVQQQSDGWTVEICIPFTALRFPRLPEQNWGAQFSRFDRSSGELSTWSPQNPVVQDRVFQFGTLTGLRDIRQERRRSLAVHAETAFFSGEEPFTSKKASQSLGIDSRIGLNESATLDFTILPGQAFTTRFSGLGFPGSDVFTHTATPFLPEPRQFLEEERDLFSKNPGLDYYPTLEAGTLLWRVKRNPNELIFNFKNASPLQSTKLSARTRGNWRFGVFNTLLGPTKVEITSTLGERRDQTLQAVSDRLFLGAEYLLPNNSFIHVSNTLLFAGAKRGEASPQLVFRLRDRSNSLEVSGASNFRYFRYNNDKFLDFNWNLALSRINRRWGWTLQHREDYYSLIRPDSLLPLPPTPFAYSNARVQYREFQAFGPFINVSAEARLNVYWRYSFNGRNEWDVNTSLSRLDRGFRRYTVQLYTRPYNRFIRYQNASVHIYQKVSPELGGGFSFQTDYRKRFQVETSASVYSGLEGEFPKLLFSLNPGWVLGQQFRFGAQLSSNTYFQSLNVLSTDSGRWIFEQYDRVVNRGQVSAEWSPANRFQLSLSVGVYDDKKYKLKAVELLDGGTLMPIAWTFTEISTQLKPTYQLDVSYFFSSISQLRFNLEHRPGNVFIIAPFPPYETKSITNARLSFIWFIDGAQKT